MCTDCWLHPDVVGDVPPPGNSFSLSKIGTDKLALFGGYRPSEVSRGNVTYILQFAKKEAVSSPLCITSSGLWLRDLYLPLYIYLQHWQRVEVSGKLGKKQPVGRCDHAGTSFCTKRYTQGGLESSFFLLSLGGIDDAKKTLSECWILDFGNNQWRQVHG